MRWVDAGMRRDPFVLTVMKITASSIMVTVTNYINLPYEIEIHLRLHYAASVLFGLAEYLNTIGDWVGLTSLSLLMIVSTCFVVVNRHACAKT
jgi:hypothetical protein